MNGIVISGATGMTGVALSRLAVKSGIKVAALVREGSTTISRLPQSPLITHIELSLDELSSFAGDEISAFMEGEIDAFYHLGWGPTDRVGRRDPMLQAQNIGRSIEAVRLAERLGCPRFIGAGSQAEYGIHTMAKTAPDAPTNPNTAYGVSKLAACNLCRMECDALDMRFIWVRIFSLYGGFEAPGTLIQSMLPKLRANEPCDLTEGVQQWDYLHVDDAARALLCLGASPVAHDVYCLGSGQSRPVREWIEDMRDALGSRSILRFGAVPYEFGVPNGMCADISSLARDTGWEPTIAFGRAIREMA